VAPAPELSSNLPIASSAMDFSPNWVTWLLLVRFVTSSTCFAIVSDEKEPLSESSIHAIENRSPKHVPIVFPITLSLGWQ